MATILVQPGRMTFKLDTGETKDEKTIYKNVSLTGVKGTADADSLASVASAVDGLFSMDVESISLQRNELLVI
jgi:predicted transport protein